jgi:anaerobic selenocysteine-containing dehydrogenase
MADAIRHYRICPLCEACCGLEVHTRGDEVVSIRGHDGDVLSRGYVCPKAVALKDLHEDPDRLRRPMVRRAGRMVEVDWDEAFAEVERRLPPLLAEHGRDSVGLVVGNPAAHKMGLLLYFPRLARAIGSKNLFSASTLDQMPRQLASGLMYGHWLSIALPDIERTDWMLVIGANPAASNGSMWTVPDFRGKAKALRARGGRLVVIDPRRSETAEIADAHHFIRPGSDVFLLAAMVNTLFAQGLVHTGRATPWLAGVDAVRAAVAPFTPDAVAPRCGIDAATIRGLARELAAAPRACVYGRIGTCTQTYGTTVSWLIDLLNALTGRLDEPGGVLFARAPAFAANTQGAPGKGRGIVVGRHRARVSGAPEVFGELPIVRLAEEIETPGPGQIRALIAVGANPVLSAPSGSRIAAALGRLDFMVSLDLYLNETSRHADVVLPGRSPLHDGHYDVAFPQLSWRNHARYSAAVLTPPADALPEWQTLLKLTAIVQGRGAGADPSVLDDELLADELRRFGAEQAAAIGAALTGWTGPERLVDLALRAGPYGDGFGARPEGLTLARVAAQPGGIDLGELAPRLPEVLRTPSGRVELAPPLLLADLERARAGLAAPADALVIVGRRDVRSNNSWMHNLPTLAKGPQRCTLRIHPADAAARGLADGAIARIRRGAASITAPVQCSDEMMPGVVSLPHGWGHDLEGTRLGVAAQRPGANLNAVLDDTPIDPLSGTAVLSGVAVEVAPA